MELLENAITGIGMPPVPLQVPLPIIEEKSEPAEILKKSVLLNFSVKRFGIKKKVDSKKVLKEDDELELFKEPESEVEEGDSKDKKKKINPETITVSKEIIESKTLALIRRLDGQTRTVIEKQYCLPSLIKRGIFLVPIGNIEKVNELFENLVTVRNSLINQFVEEYKALTQTEEGQAKLKNRLGDLYNPEDYPSIEKVRSSFGVDWSFITFETPETLKGVKAELFKKEQEKAEKKWVEVTADLQQLLRVQALEMVDHMIDRLTPDAANPDKKKTFKAGFVEKVKTFLSNFEIRNLTDDKELSIAIVKARQVLDGVDPQLLRDDEYLRNKVLAGFSYTKNLMNEMVITKKRAIKFGTE